MKRSKTVLLKRLRKAPRQGARSLAVAIASVMAAGCSFKEEVHLFKTVDECSNSPKFDRQDCEVAYQKALVEARKTAPRYRSLKDCEYDFGYDRCESYQTNNASSSVFLPAMAGFMVGQAIRNSQGHYYSSYNPLFYYYGRGYSGSRAPVWTTADGNTIANGRRSKASVGKEALKPKATPTRTMSRGGFGSTVSAKSSWGGGKSSRGSWGG